LPTDKEEGMAERSLCHDGIMTILVLLLALLVGAIGEIDGRSLRREATQVLTVSNNYFEANYNASEEAFRQAFRMSRTCFRQLARYLRTRWSHYYGHASESNRTVYSLEMKLALTLRYLGSRGSLAEVASQFGMSVSTASRAYFAICRVLYDDRQYFVRFPSSEAGWQDVVRGFKDIGGFDRVVGAVDGTLIKRSRPSNFWGWYCRKSFTAYNMQAVVDSSKMFMEFSIRPGSCNDCTLWNGSWIGSYVRSVIPFNHHFLGDGGYMLREYLLTPFAYDARKSAEINRYNLVHSRTRIPVECAFGALKGRFQILRRELESHSEQIDGTLIGACIVLHNFCMMHESDSLGALSEIVADEDFNSLSDEMLDHGSDEVGFERESYSDEKEHCLGSTKRSFYLRQINEIE